MGADSAALAVSIIKTGHLFIFNQNRTIGTEYPALETVDTFLLVQNRTFRPPVTGVILERISRMDYYSPNRDLFPSRCFFAHNLYLRYNLSAAYFLVSPLHRSNISFQNLGRKLFGEFFADIVNNRIHLDYPASLDQGP